MNQRSLLAALLVALAAPQALGQSPTEQLDRRNREQPEIVVEAAGRYGGCDSLLFDRDGQFLFTGGDDKVVRYWPYSPAGLDTTHDPANPRVLRWRAWREQRGGIKAVAVSPDGKRVAIGGYGLKPSTVAIVDRQTGETVALTWPKGRPGIDRFNVVTAAEFDAEGKRVAFGTADGSVWVWDPQPQAKPDDDGRPANLPRWAGRHDKMMEPSGKPADFNQVRMVHFADRNTLISVAQSGQVLTCDVGGMLPEVPTATSPAKPLFDVNAGQREQFRVFRAVVTPDGKSLVFAMVGPQVVLKSLDGKETVRLPLKNDQFPRSIAVQKKTGRLAVGVGAALPAGDGPRFFAESSDEIWLYDNPTKGGEPKKLAHRGPAEALAFHPTDNRLAVAGGDADEVTLIDLATEKPVSVARGAGRRPWAVNISENGKVIGIQTGRDIGSTDPNRRGAGAWTRFDVPRLMPTLDESQKWVGPVAEADGWKIIPDKGDRYVWHAVRGNVDLKLGTNRNSDNAPTCFTFLPAQGNKPTRVIVGHYYGCSLFELLPERAVSGVLPPAKVFTGHGGEVLSVVAARDQTFFVTGGADQTVAAWSLADWTSVDPTLDPGLGAAFAVKNKELTVTGLAVGSPAWEAGLQIGDVLDLVAIGGPAVPQYDRRPVADRQKDETWGDRGTPEEALALIKVLRPRVEFFFSIKPTAKAPRRTSLTTGRQRPVWKWFPAFNAANRMTDWVIWMWQGSYYHTKSAHGDRLAGWHVNHPEAGGTPEFYRLDQFEKQFHRLDVIEKLVNTRDVGAALIDALGDNPQVPKFTEREPAPVRVAVPKSEVGNNGLGVTVTAKPRGANPDLLPERVELWVNDHRYKVWPANGRKPFDETLTIPPEFFRAGDNNLAVLTFNPLGGRAEEFRRVSNPRAAEASVLLGLTVGINDYAAHRQAVAALPLKRKGFDNLVSAKKDAQVLTEKLLSFRGANRFFRDGRIDLRLDADAGRDKLTGSLDEIAKQAKPDDLLIVFFAGHGDLLVPAGPMGAAVGGGRGVAGGAGLFVFCCPNYAPNNLGNTSLSADELFEALAKVRCRKVVLLDACHSGQAVEANVIRRFIPDGQGPFVIAACDQSEQSYEHPRIGHGLFTYAVLDALGDDFRTADYNSDGSLSPEELYQYVAVRVPALMKEIGKPADTQNPICFPRQPPQFTIVKK